MQDLEHIQGPIHIVNSQSKKAAVKDFLGNPAT